MKKILLLIGTITAVMLCSSSCNKEEDGDNEDKMVCGGDSCLIAECKNHPDKDWIWEHCYDFSIKSTTLFSTPSYYYRQNIRNKGITEDLFQMFYGRYTETIIHEYDIWNRTRTTSR